jgi:hypothetical protein
VANGVVLIATTWASASSGPCVIRVWQWRSKDDDWGEEGAEEGWTLCEVVGFLVKLMVVCAAIAYVAGFVKQAVCKLYFPSCS